MMEDLSIKTDDVALYAGLVGAVFSVCQALSGVGWGVLSDMYGRKTALMAGMIGLLFGTLLFGFSSSVAWAMISRAISGLSSGNVGISRTVVAELVPQKELQPTAFRIMPAVWSMGAIFGPGLGGALARPASTMPSLFGNNAFFKRFPYALPNLVVGTCFICGVIVAFLFLQVRSSLQLCAPRESAGKWFGPSYPESSVGD
jgi:MFS family permease